MKVSAFIRKSAKKNDTDSSATIYFRLRDGSKDIKAASELSINPNHWSAEKQGYKDRVALVAEDDKLKLNNDVRNIVSIITKTYTADADSERDHRKIPPPATVQDRGGDRRRDQVAGHPVIRRISVETQVVRGSGEELQGYKAGASAI